MKTCKADNCISPVFSHLYCQRHQYKRDDRPTKQIFAHKSMATRVRDYGFPFESQIELFQALWNNAGDEKGYIVCPFTGTRLNGFFGTDLWVNCFLHILPKKNYPYFKLNPANIVIAYHEFHRIVDAGTQKERAEHPTWRFDLWDARVIAMKAEYIAFKKLNLLA